MAKPPDNARAPTKRPAEEASRRLAASVRDPLRAVHEPDRAAGQQRYMKSAMPFMGVRVPTMPRTVRAVFDRESEGECWLLEAGRRSVAAL